MSTSLNYLEGLAGTMTSGVTSSLMQDHTQDKVETLKQNAEAKLSRLNAVNTKQQNILGLDSSLYRPAILDSVTDADTFNIRGNTGGDRAGGDPTIPNNPLGWVDASETYHGSWSETPKEVARIAKQQEVLSTKLGRPATTEDVFRAGETAKLNALYEAVRSKDDPAWTPGPIEYDAKNNPIILGDKNTPLNIPINAYYTGNNAVGDRGVGYYKSADNSGNVNAMLADPKVDMNAKPYTISNGNVQEGQSRTTPLGSISKKYESGGDVSAIAPDTNNTTSYGIYQMNSAGTMQNFLNSPEGEVFGSHLNKYEVGSPDFNATYKKLATNYGDRLAEAQQSYMQRTHFEPIVKMAEENGVNVNDPKIQETLWSQSVQHSPQGNAQIVKNAVASLGNGATQDEVVQALYNSRNAYVQGLSTIDDKTKAQLANRYTNEMKDVLNGAEGKKTTVKNTDRSWNDAIKDTGLQLVVGSENTVKNLADIYGLATGDMNNTVSQLTDQASKFYSEKYSPALKAVTRDKASKVTEGKTELDKFMIATKENFKNPMLISQLVTESAPMMVAALAAGEGMAAASGVSALEGMLSSAAIQQGADMGQEVYNSFFATGPNQKVSQKDWDNNPKYQELISKGATSNEAKQEIALATSRGVALASGLLSYGVNKFMPGGHAIEEKLVGLGSKGTGVVKALVGESTTEAMEEGGGKAFQNIGLQQINPDIKTQQDVGVTTADAMSAGGATTGIVKSPEIVTSVSELPSELLKAGKKGIELATETPLQKDLRQLREYSTPLQEEAVSAATTGDYQTVADRVEKAHGKLVDQLDPSASKGRTYATVLDQAMNNALVNGDEVALDNVYKTMKELHNDKNVEFDIKDVVHKEASQLAQEFVRVINSGTKDTEDVAAKFRGEVGKEADKQASIIEAVKGLREIAEIKASNMKSVMGTDLEDSVLAEITELQATIDGYLANPTLEKTNQQVAKLGYLVLDPEKGIVSDPSRPGLAVYEEALTEQLLNPKVNKSLLAKELKGTAGASVEGGSRVRLEGLTEFAKSRTDKLMPRKNKSAVQTQKLMENMLTENEQMAKVIENVLATANGLTGLDESIKQSYIDELETAKDYVKTAKKRLAERQAILSTVTKPEGLNGALAYQMDKDGNESIQVMNKVDDKWTYTKVANVVDGKVKMLDNTTVQQKAKTAVEPDEVVHKEDYKDEYIQRIKKVMKDREVSKESPTTKIMQNNPTVDKTPNKENMEYEAGQQMPKVAGVVQSNNQKEAPKDPLRVVRDRIATMGEAIIEVASTVDDMNLKTAIKNYYKKELADIDSKLSVLQKSIVNLEKDIKIGNISVDRLINVMRKLALEILTQIDQMTVKLGKVNVRTDYLVEKKNILTTEMNALVTAIDVIEAYYGQKTTTEKTAVGTITKYEDSVYGPMAELGDKRKSAEPYPTKKDKTVLVTPATAMSTAMKELGIERANELIEEGSLGGTVLANNIKKFTLISPIVKILKQTEDSIFGKMNKEMFSNPEKLIENLPKSFKEIFASKDESKDELIKNINTMDKFIKGVGISDILVSVGNKLSDKTIDSSGYISKFITVNGVEQEVPVEMLGLLGNFIKVDNSDNLVTYKTGNDLVNVLEVDERVKTIIKFYAAKLISDTQSMVGKIGMYDESEMSKYFSIYDAEELIEMKEAASQGYVAAASVRSDIGDEVYSALGFKFTNETPEKTKQTFIDSLGALVQAAAVDSGLITAELKTFGSKNQTMIRVNLDEVNTVLGTVKNGTSELAKAINKLQYMTENRSRSLLSKTKPKPKANGTRLIMNTKVPVSDSDNELMNNEEKKAYTIDTETIEKYLKMSDEDFLKSRDNIDPETLPVGKRLAQQGKNDKTIREWDLLKTAYYAMDSDEFYLNWGQTVSERFTIQNDIQYQESKLHREFVHEVGMEADVDWNNAEQRIVLEGSILQALDMDPDKLSLETDRENFNKLVKVTDNGIEITPKKDDEVQQAIKEAYETLRDTGKINVEASAIVFAESEGHHGLSAIEVLVKWNKAIVDGVKSFKTKMQLESDAITSGMILTLLQIGTAKAIELLEKGGVYTKQQLEDRTKYVQYWLGSKDKQITFSPGALIEAGKKHATAIEDKEKGVATKEQLDMLEGQEQDITSNKVFKDLYSTIGVAMLEDVKTYRKGLDTAKKDGKLTEEGKLQLAIFDQLGELNLKNIRSIAKSPVMVYVYGASMNSIKTKLGFSLGVDTLTKAISTVSKLYKKVYDNITKYEQELMDKGFTAEEVSKESVELNDVYGLTEKEVEELNKNNDFIDLFVPDKNYVTATGTKVDVSAMPKWKQILHIDINAKLIKRFKDLIDKSFGKAIEESFDKEFGFINENRDAMKALEVLQFEMYQIKLTEKIKAKLLYKKKTRGKADEISEEDLREINAELVKEGFGHTIVWEADGETKYQPMTKSKKVGSDNSTIARVGNTKATVSVKEQRPTVNTGAMATIPIHAIDGNLLMKTLNSSIRKTGGKNIYDAIATMLNAEMIKNNGTEYNTNVIEVGFSRSIIADQLKLVNAILINDPTMLEKVAKNIGLRPKGKNNADYAKEVNRLGLGIGRILEVLEIVESNNKERVINSGQEWYSAHMYIIGQAVTKVEASDKPRAKELPEYAELKQLLMNVKEADRKVTHKEFANKKITLHNKTDFVLYLDDIVNRTSTVESKANLAQVSKSTEMAKDGIPKLKVDDNLVKSLSSKDVVQIIGTNTARTTIANKEINSSQKFYYDELIRGILKSDAGIVVTGMDEQLENSGRILVDGVWMKETKAEAKVEEGTLSEEQITKLKEIFMKDGVLKSGIAKLLNALPIKIDMKDC